MKAPESQPLGHLPGGLYNPSGCLTVLWSRRGLTTVTQLVSLLGTFPASLRLGTSIWQRGCSQQGNGRGPGGAGAITVIVTIIVVIITVELMTTPGTQGHSDSKLLPGITCHALGKAQRSSAICSRSLADLGLGTKQPGSRAPVLLGFLVLTQGYVFFFLYQGYVLLI